MLIPIGALAAGSILAGFPFKGLFADPHGVEHFFGESLKMNPHILEDMEHMPFWLGQLPFIMMVGGFAVSYFFYISRPDIPEELAAQQPLARAGVDEHAAAAPRFHQLLVGELLVALEHGQRVDAVIGGDAAHRRQRIAFGEGAVEDHRHHAVAQLPVDRLPIAPLPLHCEPLLVYCYS